MMGNYKVPSSGIYYADLITDCNYSIIVLSTKLKRRGDNLSPYLTPLLDGIPGNIACP